MGRPTFNGYAVNIEAKTGKSLDDFWQLAGKKGFVTGRKVVGTHAELLKWLKSDIGLGHVHATLSYCTSACEEETRRSAPK